ncbi:MAG: response regulator [bacterium]
MPKKVNLLIVDDEVETLRTLDDIFEDRGYVVTLAEDGYKAIEFAKKKFFDIILMDVKMPGINGLETFREIKKICPSAVVIMMTGYSVEELLRQAIEEGAYAVIYKPFDMRKLFKTIEGALGKTLIMVVDDLVEDRETLKDILINKGYRVVTASDGYEALNMVPKANFDIILLDVKMPRMDGIKTLEWIKEMNPETGVIMMSAYSMDEFVGRALREGALAFLYKPFDMKKLFRLIEEYQEEKEKIEKKEQE